MRGQIPRSSVSKSEREIIFTKPLTKINMIERSASRAYARIYVRGTTADMWMVPDMRRDTHRFSPMRKTNPAASGRRAGFGDVRGELLRAREGVRLLPTPRDPHPCEERRERVVPCQRREVQPDETADDRGVAVIERRLHEEAIGDDVQGAVETAMDPHDKASHASHEGTSWRLFSPAVSSASAARSAA